MRNHSDSFHLSPTLVPGSNSTVLPEVNAAGWVLSIVCNVLRFPFYFAVVWYFTWRLERSTRKGKMAKG